MSLEAVQLSRAYDDDYALVGLNAHFPKGSATVVLGRNGAGKSTLLGLLGGALFPSEGKVLLDGVPLDANRPDHRRQLGYLGHRVQLYAELSALENLEIFGELWGVGAWRERARELLTSLELPEEAWQRPVGGYSRGMMQRVALARTLLPNPPILLLDEPLTGLDPAGVARVLAVFGERRAAGATVIFASHDLAASQRLADHALVLKRGRGVFMGPVLEPLEALFMRLGGAT